MDHKHQKLPAEIILEKQRLLQVAAERKLQRLRKQHNAFLDRYYDYKQTELKDGPAATLLPK